MIGLLAHLIMRAPMWFSYSERWVRIEGWASNRCYQLHPEEWTIH